MCSYDDVQLWTLLLLLLFFFLLLFFASQMLLSLLLPKQYIFCCCFCVCLLTILLPLITIFWPPELLDSFFPWTNNNIRITSATAGISNLDSSIQNSFVQLFVLGGSSASFFHCGAHRWIWVEVFLRICFVFLLYCLRIASWEDLNMFVVNYLYSLQLYFVVVSFVTVSLMRLGALVVGTVPFVCLFACCCAP